MVSFHCMDKNATKKENLDGRRVIFSIFGAPDEIFFIKLAFISENFLYNQHPARKLFYEFGALVK